MPQLATNPRTQVKAAIKRGSARARLRVRDLDARMQREVERIYKTAADDLRNAILAHADTGGTVRLQSLQQLLSQVNQRLATLGQARDQLLDEALSESADLGIQPYTSAVNPAFITRAADEALNFVTSFIDENGLQLSDRIWRLDNGAQQLVGDAIKQAVIQGHSASQAVNDFLSRGQPVPVDIANKLGMAGAERIANLTGEQLLRIDGNARAHAMTVFRTEINRAHGEAYMLGGEEHPDFGGWKFLLSPRHPRADICDMHASVNRYGLGPGVYPTREAVPWPAHPNTLSFVEIVFNDEITQADKDGKEDRIEWLKKQPGLTQEGVLNSRKKRALLQQDLLRENEINTPWNVLKKRVERRGVNVADLVPKPEANFRDLPINDIRQEAYDYVVTKGEATGWEHAVVYDTNKRTEYLRKTTRSKNSVGFDRHELSIFNNPHNKLELVHNHPSSSSLSLADLRFATQPGVNAIVAVGHNGTIYRASALVSPDLISRAYRLADRDAFTHLTRNSTFASLSNAEKNQMHQHLINTALGRAELISYQASNLSGALADAADKMGDDFFNQTVDILANNIIDEVL